MSLYTDEDVDALALHLWDEGLVRPESLGTQVVTAVLDAVAPTIAARALREAADSAQHYGTAATNASAVRVWLRDRADEIERGQA